MRRSLFAVVMLLALAGAARADEQSKATVPVAPQPTRGAHVSPVPIESHIASQVYVGEPAPTSSSTARRAARCGSRT